MSLNMVHELLTVERNGNLIHIHSLCYLWTETGRRCRCRHDREWNEASIFATETGWK